MPKLVKKVSHDFTIINNNIFRDFNLGATERGLLCTMLSLADGWNFSIRGLAKIMPDGVTKISTALKNIENANYLIRKRVYEKGKIVDWEYIISDEPMRDDSDENSASVENPKPDTQFLDIENLDTENLNQENQDIENRDGYKINKNKISKNIESSDIESINQSSNSQSCVKAAEYPIDENDRLINLREKREAAEIFVKTNIEYDWYEEFFAETPDNTMYRGESTFAGNMAEIDMIVGIIVDTICSEKEFIRIGKEDIPHSVVESRFKKLEMKHIEYALKCLMLNTKDIRNPLAYITTVLYNASIICDFAENNELKNIDPALFIPEKFHDEKFREKHYGHTALRPSAHSEE